MSNLASPPIKDAVEDAASKNAPILEHLNELRIRLTWMIGSLLVATIISLFFVEEAMLLMLSPYQNGGSELALLQTLRPTEGIETFFKVGMLGGAILAMPMILYQVWLFIAPGLEKREKRYVYLFLPIAFALFGLGIWFAWVVLVPAAVSFLSTFMPQIFATEWTGEEYVSFILAMLFWLGVSFEMPVIAYFVARVGVVEAKSLSQHWRYAVVGIAFLAAAITPSIDPITMLLTMAPLLVLYVLSIGTAYIGQRQFQRSMATSR